MRNKFLNFCFAWFPGAGQMYQGYMKRGSALMLGFFGIIIVANILGLVEITLVLPVIWAYSFFDTFNIGRYTPEERLAHPDTFLFGIESVFAKFNLDALYEKRHKWVGWGLLLLGVLIIYNNFISRILWSLYNTYQMDWLARIIDGIPTLAIAIVLLFLGIKLLKNSANKRETDDIVEFSSVNKQ